MTLPELALPSEEPRDGFALATLAARAADDKLAEMTVVLDVSKMLDIFDAFVIASGQTARQVDAIVDAIEASTKSMFGRGPLRIEGRQDFSWVLMDYGDVLVHVFLAETRAFYDLEHLWTAAPRVAWES